MKKSLLVLLSAAIAISLWWWSRSTPPLALRFAAVERGTVESTVANTRAGTVKACRRSGLSMPGGGRVELLHVREGQRVAAGELLLELWNDDRKAMVTRSEAELAASAHRREQACGEAENAERESRRLQTLYARALSSQEAAETAATRARSAMSACRAAQDDERVAASTLALQRALLAETQLRAPFAGTVAEIEAEPGEFVTPSPPGIPTPPAVDLIDYACLYVTAPIDEVDAGRLRPGLPARISLDAFRGEHFNGRLARIAPYVQEIEKQARTVDVDVEFDDPRDRERLLVGYSADIDVILESREGVLRIPTEALLEDDTVYRLDEAAGRVERVAIKAGIRNWNWTEVLSGLGEGERVVLSLDIEGLIDGARARPAGG
jgi:HlyD family secretion protein